MKIHDMKQQREAALDAAQGLIEAAERGKRDFTDSEKAFVEGYTATAKELGAAIEAAMERNTLRADGAGGTGFFGSSSAPKPKVGVVSNAVDEGKASAARSEFASWVDGNLQALSGGGMSATSPAGFVSVGTGSGTESVATTISTQILPLLQSYFALDSFGQAGATLISTDNTRPLFQPVLSAGAADAVFAENTAPATSQPFGLSGFTFGGLKYSRLVLASYEALMNSEISLQGAIMDELLAGVATTLTTATTVSMYAALTAASSTLSVGGGSGNDIYSTLIDLRHAVPPRYDLPANRYMLSRATLATIRNKRASTSGVAMFDPVSDQILGKNFVINDNFDAVCGAGFVAYGSWSNGCYLRRTPCVTRVFDELYAGAGQVGFRTTQWADAHFLAELAGAAQPPSAQPLYYASITGEL